jgi:hypothetical protein
MSTEKIEPPSRGMHVKTWAKHLLRSAREPVKIKGDPRKYLNSHERRRIIEAGGGA